MISTDSTAYDVTSCQCRLRGAAAHEATSLRHRQAADRCQEQADHNRTLVPLLQEVGDSAGAQEATRRFAVALRQSVRHDRLADRAEWRALRAKAREPGP